MHTEAHAHTRICAEYEYRDAIPRLLVEEQWYALVQSLFAHLMPESGFGAGDPCLCLRETSYVHDFWNDFN